MEEVFSWHFNNLSSPSRCVFLSDFILITSWKIIRRIEREQTGTLLTGTVLNGARLRKAPNPHLWQGRWIKGEHPAFPFQVSSQLPSSAPPWAHTGVQELKEPWYQWPAPGCRDLKPEQCSCRTSLLSHHLTNASCRRAGKRNKACHRQLLCILQDLRSTWQVFPWQASWKAVNRWSWRNASRSKQPM